MFKILFLASSLFAAQPMPQVEYHCKLTVVADDIEKGYGEVEFDRPEAAPGSHGGDVTHLEFGPHSVDVQIDGRWRTIVWSRNGKMLGNIMTVSQAPHRTNHVIVMVNPLNEDEQISLVCDLK